MEDEKDDDESDRLRDIHHELSTNPIENDKTSSSSSSSSSWLPLESNPEMFTSFCRRIGNLPQEWSFIDVLSFDNQALQLIPRPVAAVILLFPCTETMYAARAAQKKKLLLATTTSSLTPAAKNAFHVMQVASFGNACGSIAAVHALANNRTIANGDGPLAQFTKSTAHLTTAQERGNALVSSLDIHGLSDQSASDHIVAQTACPENGDTYLGHHYCCFVNVDGCIVELDGTKVCPVDHGTIPSDSDLLQEAGRVVRQEWMRIEPNRIDFSLMALAKTG